MAADEITTDVVSTTTGAVAGREVAEQSSVTQSSVTQSSVTMARTGDLVRKLTSLADRYDAAEDGDAPAADRRRRVALMRTTAESGRRLMLSLVPPAPPLEEQAGPPYPLVTRLEESAVIRQAQGILMQRAGLTAQEAAEALLPGATGQPTPDAGATRPWASATALSAVVEHAGLGIALLGPDGVALQANPAFCRMLGYSEAELLTMTCAAYTHPDDVERDEAQLVQLRAGGSDGYRVEKRYVRQDGGVVSGALSVSAVRGSDGGLLFAVGVVEDVTEQRRLREQLRHQAMHDDLTGLPNRRLFDDRFAHAQSLARRQAHALAVIVLDLDGFEAVNDRLGPAAGDEVLVAVAATLAAACRDSDTVARVGGDEFAVLCEGPGTAQHARALSERLRRALAVTLVLGSGARVAVSASVGFAVADAADEDGALLRRAGAAMHGPQDHPLRSPSRGA